MRLIHRLCFAAPLLLAPVLSGDDTGVPPRSNVSSYPVHNNIDALSIGAALAPAKEVKKILPPEIVNKFIVVEVGVFPNGPAIHVDPFDFALKYGPDVTLHPATPEAVVAVWKEKDTPFPGHGVDVGGDTGVVCSTGGGPVGPGGTNAPASSTNPNASGNGGIYGRTRGCGTYTDVGVGVGQPAPGRPVHTDPDHTVEWKARAKALPDVKTADPVAGYLFFALPSKKQNGGPNVLRYSKDGENIQLQLPAK